MIQLFFFMSMLAIAALLLNMFWYIEDSHREEDRFDKRHNYTQKRNHPSLVAAVPMRPARYRTHANEYGKQSRTVNDTKSICRPKLEFYNVGTSEEDSSYASITMNQSECA